MLFWVYSVSSVCLRLSQFSKLSFMKYIKLCVFSLAMSISMIVRIYVLYHITITKSEVWPICHSLGLAHEAVVCAGRRSIFSWIITCIMVYYSSYTPLATVEKYRKISNIRHTLTCNKLVDHSDVVGASPVGAAPTTSSFSTQHLALIDLAKTTATGDENHLSFGIWCVVY